MTLGTQIFPLNSVLVVLPWSSQYSLFPYALRKDAFWKRQATFRLPIAAILICILLYLHSQPDWTLHHGNGFLMPLTFGVWYHYLSPCGWKYLCANIRCTNPQTRGHVYKRQTGVISCLQHARRHHLYHSMMFTQHSETSTKTSQDKICNSIQRQWV